MELTADTMKSLWPELEWEDCIHGSYDVRGLLKPCINNIPFVSVTESAGAWVFELRAGATVLLNVVKHPFSGGRIIRDFRERVESEFPGMLPYKVAAPESAAEKLFLRDMLAILGPIAPEDTSIPHLRKSVKEELQAVDDALHKLRVYAGVGYVRCLKDIPDAAVRNTTAKVADLEAATDVRKLRMVENALGIYDRESMPIGSRWTIVIARLDNLRAGIQRMRARTGADKGKDSVETLGNVWKIVESEGVSAVFEGSDRLTKLENALHLTENRPFPRAQRWSAVVDEAQRVCNGLHSLRGYAGISMPLGGLSRFPAEIEEAFRARWCIAEGIRLLFKVHELTFSDRLAEAAEVMKAIDALGVKEDPLYKAVRDLLYGKGPSVPANPRLERLKERVTMAILDWNAEETP